MFYNITAVIGNLATAFDSNQLQHQQLSASQGVVSFLKSLLERFETEAVLHWQYSKAWIKL